jgi:DNA polymerase sigma
MVKFPGRRQVIYYGDYFQYSDPRARYRLPYLIYKDTKSNIDSIIYVNHLGPCFSTVLIEKYFAFDKRVKAISKFVLHWARNKSIIGANKGFLSSYAFTLLVIFFLGIQEKPVLESIQLYSESGLDAAGIEVPSFKSYLKRKPQCSESIVYHPDNIHTDTINTSFIQINPSEMRRDLGYPKNEETIGELLTKFFYYFGVEYPVSLPLTTIVSNRK